MEPKIQLKEALDNLNIKIGKFEEADKERKASLNSKKASLEYDEKSGLVEKASRKYSEAAARLFYELSKNRFVSVIERHDGDTTRNPNDNINHETLGIFGVRLCTKYDMSDNALVYEDILNLSDKDIVKLVEKNMDLTKVNKDKFSRIIKAFEDQIQEYENERKKTFFLNFKKKRLLDDAIDTRKKSIEHYQKLIDTEKTPEYSPELFQEVKAIQDSIRKTLDVAKGIEPAEKEKEKAYRRLANAKKIEKALESAQKSIVTSMKAVCGYDKGLEYVKKLADNENAHPVVRELAAKIVKENTKKETR